MPLKLLQQEGLTIPTDIHIMNTEPLDALITSYIDAGADYVALHWEAFPNNRVLHERLTFTKERGAVAGIAMRPDVAIAEVIAFLKANSELVGLISQAGVYPCLSGQTLVPDILTNLQALDVARKEHNLSYQIMVDGGIEPEISGRKCFWAGADILAVGSAFFGSGRRDLDPGIG